MFKLNGIKLSISSPKGELKLTPMQFKIVNLLMQANEEDKDENGVIIPYADLREAVGSKSRQYVDMQLRKLRKELPIIFTRDGVLWGGNIKKFEK